MYLLQEAKFRMAMVNMFWSVFQDFSTIMDFLISCQVVLEWTTCLTDRQAKNMCFISSLTVLMNKLFV